MKLMAKIILVVSIFGDIGNKHAGESTDSRFHNGGNNFNKGHIMDNNVHEGSYKGQLEGSKSDFDDIRRDRMANLVDKLSAVNRENPVSALAQIDSILRQENQSSHTKTFKSDRKNVDAKDHIISGSSFNHTERSFIGRPNDDDDGVDVASETYDDDESSDVSSITNPTFQQGVSRSYNSNQFNQLYIRENDHYNMHTKTLKSNLGERTIGEFNKLAHNPSTSSFRRPRPSHLQNYSKDVYKDQNIFHSDQKREQLKNSSPPSSIQVKNESVKNECPEQHPTDFREKMLQKNLKIQADKSDKVQVQQRPFHNKRKKNLDEFVDRKKDLAEKIRGWDELSNQMSTSRSEHDENAKYHENIAAFPKRYPWDTHLNVVQTKDTSMDNAIGIEAEMTANSHESSTYTRKIKKDETSMENSGVSNERKGNHFVKARRNIKGRSDPDDYEGKATDFKEHKKDRKGQYSSVFASDHDDDNDIPIIAASISGIPQFDPSEQISSLYRGVDLNETKSNIDGKSSFAIPQSSSFSGIDDDFEPHITTKLREGQERSKSVDTRGKKDADLNEIAAGFDKLNIQNKDSFSESRSIARLACKTNLNKEPRSKDKKRGFLRAFMEKKKMKPHGHAASATVGSTSGKSNSIESPLTQDKNLQNPHHASTFIFFLLHLEF